MRPAKSPALSPIPSAAPEDAWLGGLLQPFSCHRRHQALRVAAALTQVRLDDDIDLVGSLPDPKERSAAAMKSLGIDPAFAPRCSAFLTMGSGWSARRDAVCSAGDLYQQYQARGEDYILQWVRLIWRQSATA